MTSHVQMCCASPRKPCWKAIVCCCISANGVLEERTVTTGLANWEHTEITSGLNEGDQIVTVTGPGRGEGRRARAAGSQYPGK